ncbi:uncharacterized protein UV8b_00732 [Ustilaginoidea virens]|uniref:Uncharacterized protein n=1 Tax=Ustilaginoidea virens TaxID=1159556 RepID=A0A8E5MEL5_USTVR|nr:uncharacterized protein UV8b_00732 [Ustilaginoidea virens]QUC16491.1 hypothetical protein UV8b_00732 [Ustilaginoidea virens]
MQHLSTVTCISATAALYTSILPYSVSPVRSQHSRITTLHDPSSSLPPRPVKVTKIRLMRIVICRMSRPATLTCSTPPLVDNSSDQGNFC